MSCWRHDYDAREYICRCDPPVEGDTGWSVDHTTPEYDPANYQEPKR